MVADLSDPFNVAVLTGEEAEADPARLADEAAARSLMGGRRLVRVRDARDRSAEALSNAFAGPETDTLVVVEAGDLKSTSALRKLFEGKRGDLAAIRCYPDEARDVIRMIRETLSAAGVAPYSKWQRRRSSFASLDIAACLPFFSTISSRYVVRMWSPWFSYP